MAKKERWGKEFKDKRDWKIYNEELVIRGEFFFDFDFLDSWDKELKEMNQNKVGSPYQYPNSLFKWVSPMYNFLDSRKLEGALRKLSYYIPKLQVCDYSTIIERLHKLEIDLDFDRSKSRKVISDTTGNKVTNRGEYIRHKWRIRRGWLKVSILIDKQNKDLLDVEVSLETMEDYLLAKKHLANLEDIKIEEFDGDGAYYVEELYKLLDSKGIKPVIRMPKNASDNGLDPMHSAVREMVELGGYVPWRDAFGYGFRWNVEGYISSTKRVFGECVRMHRTEYCLKEAKLKFINYERMKNYARNKIKVAI